MIAYPSMESVRAHSSSRRCSRLKYQRVLRGWSLKDVAREVYALCVQSGCPEVGVNQQTVSRWECGTQIPRPIYRKHLCLLYGLDAAQLGLIAPLEEVQA